MTENIDLRTEHYPEAPAPKLSVANRYLRRIEGAVIPLLMRNRLRDLEQVVPVAASHGVELANATDTELVVQARKVAAELRRAGPGSVGFAGLMFAIVREASGRVLGMRHHDVQLVGGYALLKGHLAEMNTGEGKTLTATLPAIAVALGGEPVHVVTVNDYLAGRDSQKLAPLYEFFGLSVGLVKEGMKPEDRRLAYGKDVTYLTNKELAFDYLKDRLIISRMGRNIRRKIIAAKSENKEQLLMRGLHYCIIDEADSVLFDEARTPLILSAEANSIEEERMYAQALKFGSEFIENVDYRKRVDGRSVEFTREGVEKLEEISVTHGGLWSNATLCEDLLSKAVTAIHLMLRDDQYVVREGKIAIVDEYTGRIMADRSWSDGLHQMVELKEGLAPSPRRVTLASMTYQRFFRRYRRIAGMSGTLSELASEVWEVYRLQVIKVPPHRKKRLRELPDMILPTLEKKWYSIARLAQKLSAAGVPVLVGTRSVGDSLEASRHLSALKVRHRVLNAANDHEEAELIAKAGWVGNVTVATNMAGRGTDIGLGPGAAEKGGLFVIVSERHDSARIDRQLVGRTARQGEPGACMAIMSLEDPILLQWTPSVALVVTRYLLARKLKRFPAMLMRFAQIRAESHNAAVRRQLLVFDDKVDNSMAFSGEIE